MQEKGAINNYMFKIAKAAFSGEKYQEKPKKEIVRAQYDRYYTKSDLDAAEEFRKRAREYGIFLDDDQEKKEQYLNNKTTEIVAEIKRRQERERYL